MSSRNKYLSGRQRQDALCLRRALDDARRLFAAGERDVDALRKAMVDRIEKIQSAEIDYIAFVDDRTLAAVETMHRAGAYTSLHPEACS